MLKSHVPVAALVYQLAEALGPLYSHRKYFCSVVLECELVTRFQTPFHPHKQCSPYTAECLEQNFLVDVSGYNHVEDNTTK